MGCTWCGRLAHCPDRRKLCDRCYAEELHRLRSVVDALADKLVATLQASLVHDGTWTHCVTETSELVTRRIDPLAEDPRLRAELARMCAARARTKLEASLPR